MVPVAGSYTSALAKKPKPKDKPPVTRTLPEGNSVAVWYARPVARGAVGSTSP